MPKQIAVTALEGTRRRGRPGKMWRGEVEEDVNVIGVKNRQVMPETVESGGRIYWKQRSIRTVATEEEKDNSNNNNNNNNNNKYKISQNGLLMFNFCWCSDESSRKPAA